MRDYNGVITFDPRLPESWQALNFQISLQGTRIRVELTHDQISFRVLTGSSAEFFVRGEKFTVSTEAPVTVQLVDHGPRIDGVPKLQTGERRPDGTLITASVPQPSPPRRWGPRTL
jgi:alpha,alpha-trehalose phosphorylase